MFSSCKYCRWISIPSLKRTKIVRLDATRLIKRGGILLHFDWKKDLIYLRKGNRLTGSSCPPTRKHFLARHSTRWSTLIGNPINCSEAICGIVIPSSPSYTGCKLSTVNAFNPRCGGLVYNSSVRIVYVVNGQLYVDFLIRVKYERFKLDDFTLILCPGWIVLEGVSSFLKRKTYK